MRRQSRVTHVFCALALTSLLVGGCPGVSDHTFGRCIVLHADAPKASVRAASLGPFFPVNQGNQPPEFKDWTLSPPRRDVQIKLTEYAVPTIKARFLPGNLYHQLHATVSATDFSEDYDGVLEFHWRDSTKPSRLRVLIQGPQQPQSYVRLFGEDWPHENGYVSATLATPGGGFVAMELVGDSIHLNKFDANGDAVWDVQAERESEAYIRLVHAGSAGFIITQQTHNHTLPNGLLGAALVDPQGVLVWNKDDEIVGDISCAAGAPDGGIVIGGKRFLLLDEDPVLQKFDATGQEQWRTTLQGELGPVCVGDDGATMVLERILDANLDAKYNLSVIDANGELLQRTPLPVSYPWNFRRAVSLENGTIAAFGHSGVYPEVLTDVMVMQRDGTLVWRRTFDSGDCLALCADGGYLVAGAARVDVEPNVAQSGSVLFMEKINGDGVSEWRRNAEGSELLFVTQTPDGGFMMGARLNWTFWLNKTDSEGESLAMIP